MGFEKLIGQDVAISVLKNGIKNNFLSPSLLFYGSPSVGKMTSAIMLAKALNCKDSEFDFCDQCESCKKIDNFTHPDIFIVNTDNVLKKIEVYISVLKDEPKLEVFFLLDFLVKDLICRFLSGFFRIKEVFKTKTNLSKLEEKISGEGGIEQILSNLKFVLKKSKSVNKKDFGSDLDKIQKLCSEIYSTLILDNIPIETIRDLNKKLHTTPVEGKKVFIINGIELLNIEGSNTFLKSIEEPPEANYIILITEEMDRILPTIKSRCFNIKFNNLSVSSKLTIIQELFKNKNIKSIRGEQEILENLSSINEEELLNKKIISFFDEAIQDFPNNNNVFNYKKSLFVENITIEKLLISFVGFLNSVLKFKYNIKDNTNSSVSPKVIKILSKIPDFKISELIKEIETSLKGFRSNNVSENSILNNILTKISHAFYEVKKI